MDWKAIVSSVAPTLATALGGPLAGAAVAAIGNALGIDKPTQEAVQNALRGATPDDLLKLKTADQAFQAKMAELGVDLEKIAAADRDSARGMQVSTRSYTAPFLAVAVTAGFFAILGAMMVGNFHPANNDALLLLLGSLGTAWGSVIAFYFGSSASSHTKDATIAAQAQK